ncbi:MAG: pseudouridine-5'-phosphate glycosidase [Eubacteriales bacterium]|nr:pseudouridine-5'-phosphate glycosidase [Eubacteriales bacterium]
MDFNSTYIEYSEEVLKALQNNEPVVAIETGGTFEGIPYPENVETANKVMDAVRENGATPAYISIMNGKIKVGMSKEEIEDYGKRRGTMQKASRREIPLILAKGAYGVMTLAATMVVADMVGIPVVSGGGMGGVHRGAEVTMDISSDLEEIAVRNVIVVCSGAKSILDLSLTMEYLETKSIPVMGYQTDELPAYMAITSGIKLPCRMDSIEEVAKAYQIKNELQLDTGMLLMNPISAEYAVDADEMNAAIAEAVECSKKDQVSGKAITGYLMKYVKEKMGADSMDAQKNMLIENASLAAKVSSQIVK